MHHQPRLTAARLARIALALLPLLLVASALAAGNTLYLPLTTRGGTAATPLPTPGTTLTPSIAPTSFTAPTPSTAPTSVTAPSVTPMPSATPPPSETINLAATTATYLGGAGADSLSAVDIAADGTLLFGGTLPSHNPGGVAPVALLGGTDGALIRLAADGKTVIANTRIGKRINDLEVGSGAIIVCGDFGVAALSATANVVLWSAAPGEGRRCAAGSDGTAAALVGGAVYAYNAAGAQVGTWSVGTTAQNDIAVDGATKQVLVTGYKQDDGGACGPLQIAFVRAYSYSGTLNWSSYDQNKTQVGAANVCADTRGERIALGRDGKLYMAASINGGTGASIFARDPKDITLDLGSRNVATDAYNNAYNTGSIKMVWFGRYRPTDGALELGSSLLTRNNGKGNSISVKAITADAQGRVYLAGDAAFTIPNRDRLTIGGVPVGDYELGEPYLAVLSADFTQRPVWTTFAAPAPSKGGGSPAVGVAVRDGVAALAGVFSPATGRALVTLSALQAAPGGGSDGYAVVFPAP